MSAPSGERFPPCASICLRMACHWTMRWHMHTNEDINTLKNLDAHVDLHSHLSFKCSRSVCWVLKRSYLMFPGTLNVPPQGGEQIFRNRIKVDAYRRVGGGFAAANFSVCMVVDAISKKNYTCYEHVKFHLCSDMRNHTCYYHVFFADVGWNI